MIYGKEVWGPKLWNLFHSYALGNINNKNGYYIFYTNFSYIIPCEICIRHYNDILKFAYPIYKEEINKEYLLKWTFEIHNIVNELLDKEIYDYDIFIKNLKNNNEDNYFIISKIFNNIDYKNLSIIDFDRIYNIFLYLIVLYPIENKRKQLKNLIKKEKYKNIDTPVQFEKWINKNLESIEKILLNV